MLEGVSGFSFQLPIGVIYEDEDARATVMQVKMSVICAELY
jgi:hypothetical protein